jgi:protein-L-isoaspartate(D-aspartate) O-methyltransferase
VSDGASELLQEISGHVQDQRILDVIARVPRHRFLPAALRERAYENAALPIGCEQTISQPLVVARMLELLGLQGTELVLDIGTGSGYHAALLARLSARVLSVERHASLSAAAGATLCELGVGNVELFVGDGSAGMPSRAPFAAINVAAACEGEVPPALVEQLAPGGRLVAPVAMDPAQPRSQELVRLTRGPRGVREERLEQVAFVPLVRSGRPDPGAGG